MLGEFTSPILGAEHLGDGYYGSDDMERLIGENNDYDYTTYGYPEGYNFKRYYATPAHDFRGTEFRDVICTGGQYVHHVGHANDDYVAGWTGSMMSSNYFHGNDGVNHNYQIFHSHGCICGNFPVSCVLEKMITIETGFVVTTGNSRYGWYVPWGDGMAAHIHREFVDAYCHDHIASVGMALREAKIATAPWVTAYGEENGCLRWNIYCLNVLGDAGLYPWFEEPFTPNVVYEQGLMVGTTSTTVHVSHFDTPLDHFSVSLFDGETLLARGITDENGDVELSFEPLETVGEMHLVVTGQSAWPQTLEVIGFESGDPYVYGTLFDIEGEAQYGSQHWVSGELYNIGDATAYQVHAAVTTDCEYVTSYVGSFTIDEFAPNSTQQFDHIGLIEFADNIPDNTVFTLALTTYVGETTHTTYKNFIAMAPNLQFAEIEVNDSQGNGNGFIDPGEHVVLQIHGKNIGHRNAEAAYLTVSCENEALHLDDTTVQIGDVDIDGNFVAELSLSADEGIIGGTVFHVNLNLHTGAYITPYDYIFAVGVATETFESGDLSFLEWDTSGDLPWFVTDSDAHNGSFSVRSGAIGDDEVTRLLVYADILVDAEISFWFKTSTELRRDYFAFYIDNQRMDWWSGENDWTYVSYPIEPGSYRFQWLYDKNGHGQSGEDCVWVDDITFPRTSILNKIEETVEKKDHRLYPNPSNGSFTLELEEESIIDIYNVLGQNVMHLNEATGSRQISLSHAPKGLYFVRIQSGNDIEVKKLIIK